MGAVSTLHARSPFIYYINCLKQRFKFRLQRSFVYRRGPPYCPIQAMLRHPVEFFWRWIDSRLVITTSNCKLFILPWLVYALCQHSSGTPLASNWIRFLITSPTKPDWLCGYSWIHSRPKKSTVGYGQFMAYQRLEAGWKLTVRQQAQSTFDLSQGRRPG